MKKTLLIISLSLLSLAMLSAGRYAGDFMMIGAGAKALGMGGAFVAVANDGSAIYWNPAGISQIRSSELMAMHAFLYNGLASYDNISFCQPLPSEVTIGFNYTRLTVDEIPLFKEKYLIGTNVDERINNSNLQLPGEPDGHFRSYDDLFQFAFAKHIGVDANLGWLFFEIPFDFYFGGNVKFIKRKLQNFLGDGTGVDMGFIVKTDMASIFDIEQLGEIAFGTNFQDITGTDISWDTPSGRKDEVLYNAKLGVAVLQPVPRLKSNVTLAFDVDHVYQKVKHYGLDWEYNNLAALRVGYYDRNITCGASVRIYGINLDYALVNNPVGVTNRLGMQVAF